MTISSRLLVCVSVCASLLQTVSAAPSALPIIDLGYERQRATYFNSSAKYYAFNNIRYAANPTGELRFREPAAPKRNRGQVQTGSQDRICAQAGPSWSAITSQYAAVSCPPYDVNTLQIHPSLSFRPDRVQRVIIQHEHRTTSRT
jgi:hypothetical protein